MMYLVVARKAGRGALLALIVATCVGAILLPNTSGGASAASKEVGERHIVARVYGKPIYQDEMKTDEQSIRLSLGDQARPEDIAERAQRKEISNLARLIRRAIKDKCLEPYLASISEEAVRAEVDTKFMMGGIDEAKAEQIAKKSERILAALEADLEGKVAPDKIYEEKLAGTSVTREEWRLFRIGHGGSPDRISEFRRLIPRSLADMKANSMKSSRRDLAFTRLREEVCKGVRELSGEAKGAGDEEHDTKGDTAPTHRELTDRYKARLLRQRRLSGLAVMRAWWRQRYQDAKIVIEDDNYRGALDLLFPKAPQEHK